MPNLVVFSLPALVLSMSIVLTPQLVRESLPIGSTEQQAIAYFDSLNVDYTFATRETESLIVPAYPWQESEVGYYIAGIENVRRLWWLPSFGAVMVLRVGMSPDRLVTQIDITGGRTGYP